jgi:aspartate carbamoyltransferase
MTTHAVDRSGSADRTTPQPAASLRSRHLLGISELTGDEITLILDTAEAMKEIGRRPIKKVPTLRGRTVVNLFFEPSTRTRTSFEIAEKRLSADTLSIAVSTSSVTKGETLVDTVRNLEAMSPDMIVMRHASSGAAHLLSRICRSSIINAGDGMHEHPTQALLDAFTIREHKSRLAGLKVAIVGDLLHSRVLRSNVLLLKTMGADVWVCGPATLRAPGAPGRDHHAPWSHEPRRGDRFRRRGRAVLRHPRTGGQRRCRADGGSLSAGWRRALGMANGKGQRAKGNA